MAIDDRNRDYTKFAHRWDISRAVIGGEDVVKGKTGEYNSKTFLPEFYPKNDERYKLYVERAMFVAYTSFTHIGLLGSVFRKSTVLKVPETIEYIGLNIDGKGQGMEQFSKKVVSQNLKTGRLGILVDYPKIEDESTRTGEEQATCKIYQAENIINWNTEIKNNQLVLNKVVLLEYDKDGEEQFRYLMLDESGYYQVLYDKEENIIEPAIYPKNYNGFNFSFIPFQFIGAEDNTPSIDKPPLLDIAHINLAHYRNSADNEENLHVHGQGTLILWSDLSSDDFKKANPNGVNVGSRSGHFLGSNGGAELLQLKESQAYEKSMESKVLQMIGIGARFIQDRSRGNQVVDSVLMDAAQKESGLSTLVTNCEDGIRNCIEWIANFMSGEDIEFEFFLNRNFFDLKLSAQEQSAMIMLIDSGIMPKSDARTLLRKAGWIDPKKTDEEIESEIDTQDLASDE